MRMSQFMPRHLLHAAVRVPLTLRNRHFLLLDMIALCLLPTLALALRLDGFASLGDYRAAIVVYTLFGLAVRLPLFLFMGLYRCYWRYASIAELATIVGAVVASSIIMIAPVILEPFLPALGAPWLGLPRSVPFIEGMLVLLTVGGVRFLVRACRVFVAPAASASTANRKRVLIVGAGEAGNLIAREMRSSPLSALEPVCFVDDDPAKRNLRIHGVPVLGPRGDIPALARRYNIAEVVIAMPTAPGKIIRATRQLCDEAMLPVRVIPGIYQILNDQVSLSRLRNLDIEDLLRREPVETDVAGVASLVAGRRVLVTGAGGSIGSELCRQISRHGPSQLILLGHGENSIFDIVNELQLAARPGGPTLVPVIADIRFPDRLRAIFQLYRPDVVFHAAAHKHVPLMEANVGEAIANNVLGTRNLLEAAEAAGVGRFVLISTDKAVNPTSVMGATKRAAELLVHQAAERSGRAYVAVRFGNVLGSRGSVVPYFRKQIAAGGPVTVTHPDMRRYFMTIPEAVQLVLQAALLGRGGEVFMLDMGEPVKIVDLAHDLIRLSGFEPGRDIDVVYTGLRPGEKLFEELFLDSERYSRTAHAKVFVANNGLQSPAGELDASVAALLAAAASHDRSAIVPLLQRIVPEYRPA
jgi:FlaA1/EpsC-like NDP-sugar epimerase